MRCLDTNTEHKMLMTCMFQCMIKFSPINVHVHDSAFVRFVTVVCLGVWVGGMCVVGGVWVCVWGVCVSVCILGWGVCGGCGWGVSGCWGVFVWLVWFYFVKFCSILLLLSFGLICKCFFFYD